MSTCRIIPSGIVDSDVFDSESCHAIEAEGVFGSIFDCNALDGRIDEVVCLEELGLDLSAVSA